MADADIADGSGRATPRCCGYRARSRRAGAVAVSHRIEELDQGRLVAGLRGRHRRQRPRRTAAARGDAGLWLAVGRERRRRQPSRAPLVWIVDPIDGTRAYLAGREDWCVSVALVAGATPVLAAVFAPATDEFFFAIRGQGTTRNERPVRADGTELDFSRMAGPKPLVQRLSSSPDEITLHPRIGSLALRLCWSPTAASMPLLQAARAETGILPQRFDRAGSQW